MQERIMVYGGTGSGKSTGWLTLARQHPENTFYCVDTDKSSLRLLNTEFKDVLEKGNVKVLHCRTWESCKQTLESLIPTIKENDWLVIDKIDPLWSFLQNWYTLKVFNKNLDEYFLQLRKSVSGGSKLEAFKGWTDWCVDESTQILTKNGWSFYNKIRIGEEVLTITQDLKNCQWEEIQDINIQEGNSEREMLLLDGKSHSSLTTLDHRWRVRSMRSDLPDLIQWKTSNSLNNNDKIPMCAEYNNYQINNIYSNELVELVGWYVTEGMRRERPNRRQLVGAIYQSSIHPENIKSISKAIRTEFGEENKVHIKVNNYAREDANPIFYWNLNGAMMSKLEECAPNKCPTYEFILSLTKEQLNLFIETCLKGDGTIRNNERTFTQNRKDIIDAFEFACILNGIAIREHFILPKDGARFGKSSFYTMNLLKSKGTNPISSANQAAAIESTSSVAQVMKYNGIVWCPVTKSGTWLAKRNGTIYFTGNSVINSTYQSLIDPVMYDYDYNIYITAKSKDYDPKGELEDAELKESFSVVGYQPEGEKRNADRCHTILFLNHDSFGYYMTTVKDRGRQQVKEYAFTNFAETYQKIIDNIQITEVAVPKSGARAEAKADAEKISFSKWLDKNHVLHSDAVKILEIESLDAITDYKSAQNKIKEAKGIL